MAIGKNSRLAKGARKGSQRKKGDPFLKKDWYDVKAPSQFSVRNCGKTLVSRTEGNKISFDALKGRVMEFNLEDLNADSDQSHKKVKLCIEDVQGRSCLTDFHGFSLTRDKQCSLIRKWHTLIEAHGDVATSDGYLVRVFVVACTSRRPGQEKVRCYAQAAQIRRIRRIMVETMKKEIGSVSFQWLVKKVIADSINREIEKQAQNIFPLRDVLIRKVKVLKKPKLDIAKLMELHQGVQDDDRGVSIARPQAVLAPPALSRPASSRPRMSRPVVPYSVLPGATPAALQPTTLFSRGNGFCSVCGGPCRYR